MERKMKLVHPGEMLKMEIEARELAITEAAAKLNTTRANLSNILNGKAAISPIMSIKIARSFGGSARLWNQLQATYDLDMAQAAFDASYVEVS